MSKTIGVVMSLTDRVSPQVKKIAKELKLEEQEAKRLNTAVKKLSRGLAADFKKACQAGTVALAAVSGGTVALIKRAQDVADRIDDMSNKIGISQKGFQEWDYLLGQNGAKIESLQMGFKTLSKQIVSASTGVKTSAKIFDTLGISVYDTNGKLKNQEQVFNEVVTALQKMPEGAQKAKIANDLLGRSGSELMPLFNATSEQLARQRAEYKKLGIEISDEAINAGNKFGDSMEKINSAAASAAAMLGADLLPVATELVNYLVANMPQIRETVTPILKGVGGVVKFCVDHIKGLTIAAGAAVGALAAFKTVGFAIALFKGLTYAVEGVTVAQVLWNKAIKANPLGVAITLVGALITGVVLLTKNWDAVTGAVKKAAQALKDFFKLDKNTNKNNPSKTNAPKSNNDVPAGGVVSSAAGAAIKPAVIKKAATGTQFSSGGPTLVGEFGPEIRNLKKGDSITPARESARILGGNQNITVNLNIAGNLIGNSEFINQLKHVLALELKTAMAIR